MSVFLLKTVFEVYTNDLLNCHAKYLTRNKMRAVKFVVANGVQGYRTSQSGRHSTVAAGPVVRKVRVDRK